MNCPPSFPELRDLCVPKYNVLIAEGNITLVTSDKPVVDSADMQLNEQCSD